MKEVTLHILRRWSSCAMKNLRSGPIWAVLIHSLLRALPAGMLFSKRNENRAWSQVIYDMKVKRNLLRQIMG